LQQRSGSQQMLLHRLEPLNSCDPIRAAATFGADAPARLHSNS
jgi:hypothetical protein